jgi:hypothetical protein
MTDSIGDLLKIEQAIADQLEKLRSAESNLTDREALINLRVAIEALERGLVILQSGDLRSHLLNWVD